MPSTLKTPGVYIVEKNAFPSAVVEVATAVPAFVGWTERADNRGTSLHQTPWPISSMAEFRTYFGDAPTAGHVRFTLAPAGGTGDAAQPLWARDAAPLVLGRTACTLRQTGGRYLLYRAIALFFRNGGGRCYVVSAGPYGDLVNAAALTAGVDALQREMEPTLLVIPEAVLLPQSDCGQLQRAMLAHCGSTMKNRVAILDVWEGYRPRSEDGDVVAAFRDGVGSDFLAFGAAYYPWLNTDLVGALELSHRQLAAGDSLDTLIACLHEEIASDPLIDSAKKPDLVAWVDKLKTVTDEAETATLVRTVLTFSPAFETLLSEMARRLNLLAPAAALAGVYTMVDSSRGVWTAPANVSLSSVISPAVPLSSEEQEDLNVTITGKSVNAIRSLVGGGVLVWGARTLDGNSPDWRYVSVRRTMIMLEESIRLAAATMVFEPNEVNTWTTVKSMVANFLTGVWKRGGLAGAVAEDAFGVRVGLGETMTPQDVLEGVMRVTVLLAVQRPAEFMEVTFQQQMQKG
ncbi:phage tail sheath protein-domain-containing protein [Hyaloraphidium curvatum]|nr:phage tail sheath protein-domain-containing protein [Hyaloraphidium curvatum]